LLHGSVSGVPWLLQTYVTQGVGDWRGSEFPVGPKFEYLLGKEGEYGGGESYARIPPEHYCSLNGFFFGRFPGIICWLGFIIDEVTDVLVSPETGDSRHFRPRKAPGGFMPYVLFFPPRVATRLSLMNRAGVVLEEVSLRLLEVPKNANTVATIHPPSWKIDTAPVGWKEATN
jgi:hypothetical protein